MSGPRMQMKEFNMVQIMAKSMDSSNRVKMLFALLDGAKEQDLQILSELCKDFLFDILLFEYFIYSFNIQKCQIPWYGLSKRVRCSVMCECISLVFQHLPFCHSLIVSLTNNSFNSSKCIIFLFYNFLFTLFQESGVRHKQSKTGGQYKENFLFLLYCIAVRF